MLFDTTLSPVAGSKWHFEGRSNPEWYFKNVGIDYWLSNFFDTPVEVHSFQLGVLVGILFGVLVAQYFPKLSVLGFMILSGFLFGAYDVPFLCEQQTESCAHIRLKPWYFLTGLILMQLSVLTMTNRLAALKPRALHTYLQSKEYEDQQ